MTLTVHNQLTLLHDLLDEHINHRNGSISEYKQIKRLVQALVTNNDVSDGPLMPFLPEIYHYGIQGEIAQSFQEHINDHQQRIKLWKQIIQQINLER